MLAGCKTLRIGHASEVEVKPLTVLQLSYQLPRLEDPAPYDTLVYLLQHAVTRFNARADKQFTVTAPTTQANAPYLLKVGFDELPSLPSRGALVAGYVVSTIGLIALPVTLIAIESPIIVLLYYMPGGKIPHTLQLNHALGGPDAEPMKARILASGFFRSRRKIHEVMYRNFEKHIYDQLMAIDKQVSRRR